MEQQTDFLQDELLSKYSRRKEMLPKWIKVIAWFFLVLGSLATIILIIGFTGTNLTMSLYSFETHQTLSLTGIIILFLFALKTATAYGLLFEKDWAIKAGFADAILGIAICSYSMIADILNDHFSTLRLELIFLIPFLLKLRKIKNEWEQFVPKETTVTN